MVYVVPSYWACFGLYASSCLWKTKNPTTFRRLDLSPSSWGWKQTKTSPIARYHSIVWGTSSLFLKFELFSTFLLGSQLTGRSWDVGLRSTSLNQTKRWRTILHFQIALRDFTFYLWLCEVFTILKEHWNEVAVTDRSTQNKRTLPPRERIVI
jgi:hypothetical protein